MSMAFDSPVIGWRTLLDMYEHYLAQTPSEEGFSAAETILQAENRVRLHSVA